MSLLDWVMAPFKGRQRHRPAKPPPPVDLSQTEDHIARTDREIEQGATELDYLRIQLKLIRREWEGHSR